MCQTVCWVYDCKHKILARLYCEIENPDLCDDFRCKAIVCHYDCAACIERLSFERLSFENERLESENRGRGTTYVEQWRTAVSTHSQSEQKQEQEQEQYPASPLETSQYQNHTEQYVDYSTSFYQPDDDENMQGSSSSVEYEERYNIERDDVDMAEYERNGGEEGEGFDGGGVEEGGYVVEDEEGEIWVDAMDVEE